MKKLVTSVMHFFLFVFYLSLDAQQIKYTHADTLKGSITKEREWWDVTYYDLHVTFNIADSSISGYNKISYKAIMAHTVMQLDLMEPMQIDSIIHYSQRCKFTRDGNAFLVELPAEQLIGVTNEVLVYFHGKPRAAKMPPWDGGVIWSKDKQGNPFISIACQGMAAGVWFPNKDHMYDEVEGCSIHITTPNTLVAVSNGRLNYVQMHQNGTATYSWKVVNPINNYCIIPYIAKYTNFKDTMLGEAGILDLDYWVLEENIDKARKQFQQVKPMLRSFEYWFGKYPFYKDGYKLVEAPFLGMEHQSAIAYGNDYINGYQGRDLSFSGWGLKWDFIIVHESGHEWFGNSISASDVADNWIHESFTAYSENLYTEYLYGKQAGADYVIGTRRSILNDKPIISDYNVNSGGSLDLYYKGANMLHTIRQVANNDSIWRQMLRGINTTFYHKTVGTKQIENYMIMFLKLNLQKIFDQYLRTAQIPLFEYKFSKNKMSYRWSNCVEGFNLPMKITIDGAIQTLYPTEKWQNTPCVNRNVAMDPNFYVQSKQVE